MLNVEYYYFTVLKDNYFNFFINFYLFEIYFNDVVED